MNCSKSTCPSCRVRNKSNDLIKLHPNRDEVFIDPLKKPGVLDYINRLKLIEYSKKIDDLTMKLSNELKKHEATKKLYQESREEVRDLSFENKNLKEYKCPCTQFVTIRDPKSKYNCR